MRATDRTGTSDITFPYRATEIRVPSGKENLEKGIVAQSILYLIQYGSQSRDQPSRFSTREERHSERQDKSARLDRRHISLVTYNSGSYRKTRRAYSKRAKVNFSIEARVDTVQKQTRSTGTPALFTSPSPASSNCDLDRSSFLHDQSKSGSKYFLLGGPALLSFEKRDKKGSWNCRHSPKRVRLPRNFLSKLNYRS